MYLFFDTETTGLPRNWNAPVSDVENWPRLVQLAWRAYDADGTFFGAANVIVTPAGFTIPEDAAKIHGISHERALKEGEDLRATLERFAGDLELTTLLVAHNISYDEAVMGAEFIRAQMPNRLSQVARFCTMKQGAEICRIPGRYGYKWPTLDELHKALFGMGVAGAHSADGDVLACAECFFEMKRQKLTGRW
jgi:DNA polymerase III subunit epsilon